MSFESILANLLALIAVGGTAAFGAMYLSWRRRNGRMARVFAVTWLTCVAAFGVLLALELRSTFGGPTDATMERLVAELDIAYPDEIKSIDYENAPPLDPAIIFIDVPRAMTHEAELAFICDQVKVRVDAADSRIDIWSTTVGSWDC